MDKLEVFIGPCVLESKELGFEIAERVKRDMAHLKDDINLTFKASFDKANRTSISSFRGPGRDAGLKTLEEIRNHFQLPLLTDFHTAEEAMEVASVVDVLQIPAFLCRQTDMIVAGAVAAARFGRTLKIKKGQFLAPEDTRNIVEKAKCHLPYDKILLTERGSSFGYHNLIVDMSSFSIMKSFGVRAIYDATHSVQCPGSTGNATGGKRQHIEVLAKAAVAAGADGIFIETHPRPEQALSDAATSWPLDNVKELIEKLLSIYKATK